ncbi:MAG: hypothetical protein ABFS86_06825 [Planctomycetota bacterium]
MAVGLAVLALLGALSVAVVRILTHYPFHDECLHAHNLYLMSEGLAPHRDFWCNYPVAGYVLARPVLALAPATAGTFLGLRFLMLVPILGAGWLLAVHGRRTAGGFLWGAAPFTLILVTPSPGRFLAEFSIDHLAMLPAVGAIVLAFARPRPLRAGAATALALVSVAITPKYGPALALGAAGLVLAGSIPPGRRRATLVATVAGAAAAVVLVLGLYALSGTTPAENFRYSVALMARFKLATDAAPSPLALTVLTMLLRNLPLLLLVVLGLWGFGRAIREDGPFRHLGAIGVLLGTVASTLLLRTYMLQYVVPVLTALAAFAVFVPRRFRFRGRDLALSLVTLGAVGLGLKLATDEFVRTPFNVRDPGGPVARETVVMWKEPATEMLAKVQAILDRVPEDERFLASPQMGLIFRRGHTWLTADENPSLAGLLPEDDPARRSFEPAQLRERLADRAPAFLCLSALEHNFPAGWREIVEEYLRRNRRFYVPVPGLPEAWLRADLAR